jgi:hypothetical protein
VSQALQGSALEEAGVVVTTTSLRFRDPTALNWERIERTCAFLGAVGVAYPFWVGDVILTVERIFGDNSPEASQMEVYFPHTAHTLQNYRWVAHSIPPSRRRAGLGFGVHEAVASLPPEDRDHWLDVAEREGWKREEMRGAIRSARERGEISGPVGKPAVTSAADESGDLVPGPICPSCGRPLE